MNILLVDDHYLMIEGYKSILSYSDTASNLSITTAHNCEEAYKIITRTKGIHLDMIFIDLGLPPFPEQNITSGKDLAALAQRHLPQSKIIILTSHAEALILYDIVKTINPEGLLVKSDFTPSEFISAFTTIFNGDTYYSATVKQYLRDLSSREQYLDNYNRQIILLLAQGIKTKNLPDHLPLSISAIDKRKVQIKDYFGLDKGNDEDILRAAKLEGLI